MNLQDLTYQILYFQGCRSQAINHHWRINISKYLSIFHWLALGVRIWLEHDLFHTATTFLRVHRRWMQKRRERLRFGIFHAYMKGSTTELIDKNSLAT